MCRSHDVVGVCHATGVRGGSRNSLRGGGGSGPEFFEEGGGG